MRMNWIGGDSPLLAKEGWPRHQEDVRSSFKERTGWSLIPKCLVSDHPVCAASEAAILVVAQPPLLARGTIAPPPRPTARPLSQIVTSSRDLPPLNFQEILSRRLQDESVRAYARTICRKA